MSTLTMSSLAPPEPSKLQQKIGLNVRGESEWLGRRAASSRVDSLNRTLKVDGKFYAVMTIGGERKETKVARRSSTPAWNQLFSFNAHPNSTLRIDIFARRKMRKDLHIGSISELLSALHPSILEGSPQDVTKTISGESGARIVLRIGIEVQDKSIKEQHPIENLPAPETVQEIYTDAIPETLDVNFADLEHNVSQMHSLSRPVSTVVNGASSMPSENSDFLTTWKPFFDNIKIFCEFTDKLAEVHPYAKMAMSILSLPVKSLLVAKIVQKQMDRDTNILKLFNTMKSFYSIVNDLKTEFEAKPEKAGLLQDLFIRIARQTTECYYFISEYVKTEGFLRRTVKHALSSTDDTINEFCEVFVELEHAFHTGVAVQTQIVTVRILDKVDHILDGVEHILSDTEEIMIETDLKEIGYTSGASFGPNKGCQPGTRVAILDEIADWINSDDTHRVLLLSGAAGTGKSAIAHTIAQQFNDLHRLGSSFCFIRGEAGRGPDKLFPHMARDLADFDKRIKRALWGIVQYQTALRTTSQIALQFDNFILKPLQELTLTGPLVIVIDALDECGDVPSRQGLLELLVSKMADLPSSVRILLTSRPEADVERLFKPNAHMILKRMQDISPQLTELDITAYIHNRLSGPSYSVIDDARKSALVSRCEGLFQWASVACTFIIGLGITGLEPLDRYNLLIEGKVHETAGLDGLYTTVLSYLFPIQRSAALDESIMDGFRFIMALVLTTFEPVSVKSLSEMSRNVEDGIISLRPESILGGMGSVLRGVAEEEPIRPLHTSFRDFLLDPSRSGRYHVDTSRTHRDLTLASLHIMEKQLAFNICHLESSYLLNRHIPDLADRVRESIPAHLSYSCRFWESHLQAIGAGVASELKVLKGIEVLLKEKLLFWLEVMSLLGAVSGAARAVASIVKWASGLHTSQIRKLATDAQAFINMFGFPISQSTPHIYLSALAFSPQSSDVFKRFWKEFPQVLKVEVGADNHWPAAQHSIHAGSAVSCVAISSNGSWIVSSLNDYTIRVWDVSTGDAVGDPFKGRADQILSVAISPDGKWIVSGSLSREIRVWDTATRAASGDPLNGHTYWVRSVAFSKDGKWIVSGSDDNTIRVWDTVTHAAVGGPLEGHTDSVLSVAFSPDASQIVSGSKDNTIRVWDVATCTTVGDLLRGHTNRVTSVAFSPEGSWIVSGSGDHTIRVWDAKTHAAMGEPLRGHTNLVSSVAFSPDGSQIVSGSYDCTIRVWDVTTHAAVGDPLKGHSLSISSVAFFPDGSRIVSGSNDCTIRVWDSTMHSSVGNLLEGHASSVHSVAFSSDGKWIVSGSGDRTIRVWDATTHAAVGSPLEGHASSVHSVAFSSDGKWIVSGSGDRTIRVWDATTHAAVGDPLKGHSKGVTSVAFSSDGKWIVSGSGDRTIRVWDATTHAAVGDPLKGHSKGVTSVAFSSDGKWIVSGSDDYTIRVWDTMTHAAVGDPLKGYTGEVYSVVFSPDGKWIVSGSSDGAIRVWDTATHAALGGPFEEHGGPVHSVAFSPDGSRIVSGSDDRTIRVWDAKTHAAVGDPLTGHSLSISSVAFSPDGSRIVSGSGDYTIRVWDAPCIQDVSTNVVHGPEMTPRSAPSNTPPIYLSELPSVYPTFILISHLPEHTMRKDGLYSSTPQPAWNYRPYRHINSDGWIVGPESELVFWVPAAYRDRLWPDPRLQFAIGKQLIQLDLSQFVHEPKNAQEGSKSWSAHQFVEKKREACQRALLAFISAHLESRRLAVVPYGRLE
ncbi:hypothetical protein HETIRDRAFT_118589 [Heterobasidion irregulare TC 32-1]|uniref:C2 domain-containing protein n=1 Tax=Heterobasidion irregulare (strain TC 32-1) TaxID=747525 RepID=W4JUB2_HETIT|nr:uncharacterized protein HETIRDRAFT_118589 [Heterobasidion irregulare TC 32-1]ETW77143.1 hypothetical protein HETIRDRAFT_118589 [Heterobasidion irregulare TC 32-1]